MGALISSQCLVMLNICLQVFLLCQIKRFVTAKAVHDIRHVYDRFEYVMYGGNITGHTTVTVNGNHRGVEGFFPVTEEGQRELFAQMPPLEQANACRIPLSQPLYLMAILLIWTVTCFGELRKAFDSFYHLIWRMPIVDSMREGLESGQGDTRELMVLRGITREMQVFLTIFVLVPRFVITIVLTWLGCRWLVATENFEDILLNAVALEFILVLKELFYATVVTHRNRRDVENTKIFCDHDSQEVEAATHYNFLSSFAWLFFAMGWVLFYVYYFQMVLPGYRWDVHDVCLDWITRRYNLDG